MTPDMAALERALGNEGYTLGWLDSRIRSGKAQVWRGPGSLLITEVNIYTLAAAGDGREIVDLLRPQAEAWAAEQGVSQSIIDGRKGWNRVLQPHGYVPFNSGVRKELT